MLLPIKRVKDVPLPAYAREGDAALDLVAALDEPLVLKPGEEAKVSAGVAMEIPAGYVGLVVPRSGLGTRGLVLKNNVAVFDSNYRGEFWLVLVNRGSETFTIQPRDRIMQLLIMPVAVCECVEVDTLSDSNRGEARFGSSGC